VIADRSRIATSTFDPPDALNIFVRDGGAWIQRAALADVSWDDTSYDSYVPPFAVTGELLVALTSVAESDACEHARWGALVYRRSLDAWHLETTLSPSYDPCAATSHPLAVAATNERVVLVADLEAHIYKHDGDGWSAEAVIRPPPPPELRVDAAPAVALTEERLALLLASTSGPEQHVHVYRAGASGWSAETKIAFL
ncbi:MAG: hypothetical protein KC486_33580, partial [Myxococcales bacterium]|nr:hypothetical protein [Myxococcales bacterium]